MKGMRISERMSPAQSVAPIIQMGNNHNNYTRTEKRKKYSKQISLTFCSGDMKILIIVAR
jgi:hypothetical protein